MKQVLTQNGVNYLWGKIKEKFATITALNNVENRIPTGALASKNSVDESDLTTGVQNKLNKEAEVKELNKGYKQDFWVGTKAEYNALQTKIPTCLYIITDDIATSEYVTATDVQNAINTYKQTVDAALLQLNNHASSKNNPHSITASQIGAASSSALTAHMNNKDNPHGITAAQIGASTNKIYASTKAPTSSDGNDVDLWVVYE